MIQDNMKAGPMTVCDYPGDGASRHGADGIDISEEKAPEEIVVRLLKDRHLTLATAESCTGGLISGTIVNVSGASDVFQSGFVTYANEAKENFIGVKHKTLITYGAVSHETAAEMALGCALKAGCHVGVSSTGIAGPGGGTPEKPVGLVYIGCALNGTVRTKELHLKGDRTAVRLATVREALKFVIACVTEIK